MSPVIEGGEIGDNTLIDSVSGIASVGTYTYLGDMNLDGQVTGDDYTIIDANLNTNPPVGIAWLSGDPNLDGVVTADDSTVIDANLGLGAGNPLGPTHLLNSFAFPASETSTPALREDLLDAWLERPSQLYRNQKGAIPALSERKSTCVSHSLGWGDRRVTLAECNERMFTLRRGG